MTLGRYLFQCLVLYYDGCRQQIFLSILFAVLYFVHLLFIDLSKKSVFLCQVTGCKMFFPFCPRKRCGLVSRCHQIGNGWPWMWTIGSTSSKLKTSSSMPRAIQFPSYPVSWSESNRIFQSLGDIRRDKQISQRVRVIW